MGERFGGRQKGTPNKASADIKAAFKKHGPALVKAVMKLCHSADENVRLRALTLALERGFGKAAQSIEVSGEVAIERIERVIVDERPALTFASDGADGASPGFITSQPHDKLTH